MFNIGDQVFCPLRGCGKIEAIEERTMLNEKREYYIIQMEMAKMTVMIQTEKIATSGFRKITDKQTAEEVLFLLGDKNEKLSTSNSLKERLKDNGKKLATGMLVDYAQVVRELTQRQRQKVLNASENTMLLDARRFLVDEISIIKVISRKEAIEMIDALLA